MGFVWQSLFLIKLVVIVILAAATTDATSLSISSNNMKMAKPRCSERCGNVRVPFPFGTTKGCYLNNDVNYFVNCTKQGPFWAKSEIPITDISLAGGHLTVMNSIARDCYSQNGNRTNDSMSAWTRTGKFTVSNAANKFVVVGCDSAGYVRGERINNGSSYRTGCVTTCGDEKSVEDKGSCSGSGCCMTSIPKNIREASLSLGSFDQYQNVSNFSNCGYAFVVEERAFTFSPEMITSLRNVTKLPMVVDWAIGYGTNCSQAKANSAEYGCKSANSECYDPDNVSGYRCNCKQGYQGNPYLDGGCQDIDECIVKELNNCTELESCENTDGSFKCTCNFGDRKKEGKPCKPIQSNSKSEHYIFKLVAGISLGIIVLLLSACGLYFVHENIRLIKMRQHYFITTLNTTFTLNTLLLNTRAERKRCKMKWTEGVCVLQHELL